MTAVTEVGKKVWTEEELQALPEDGYIHEVVDGELQPSEFGLVVESEWLRTPELVVRANLSTGGARGSVLFSYDGVSLAHIENIAPFTLAGNTGNDYWSWTPRLGAHTLLAVAHGVWT